jgi:phosphopantothenoylcysteine decarboxylase/phosphopantothenate--cysteine ligase
MRHGAQIFVVMSKIAQSFISPVLFEWATGNRVVTELSGKIEHVALCNKADIVLVAPATANSISKFACGIDDTAVTSLVSVAFGAGVPIVIVPAMHESMYRHPILSGHIVKLQKLGCEFIGPEIVEGKAKISSVEKIVESVIIKFIRKDMDGMMVLVTAGPTLEYIDPIRVISNRSTGKMGIAIGQMAYQRGAVVTLIYGPGSQKPPAYLNVKSVETTEQMHKIVMAELISNKYDIVFAAAACADFTPVESSNQKIPTNNITELNLTLKPTAKIINDVKGICPNAFLVAFKAEYNREREELVEIAFRGLELSKSDIVVVNDVAKPDSGFQTDTNEVLIIDSNRNVLHVPLAKKSLIATKILDFVMSKLKPTSV